MTIEAIDTGSVRTLKLRGHLDTATAPQLDAALDRMDGVTGLVLDFAEVEYISSAGLRLLLKAQKMFAARGDGMKLLHVYPDVSEVLEITGFDSILTIE